MVDSSLWIVVPLSGLAGMVLGAFFFGGLWWTVRLSLASPRPGLLVAVSLVLRLGVVLAGFYLVASGQWQPLSACLLGFIFARFIMVRFLGPRLEHDKVRHPKTAEEVTHAP